MIQQVDIAIVGGGMVGLALAAALAEADISVAVIEAHPPVDATLNQSGLRVSALNRASQRFLSHLGVWGSLAEQGAAAYTKMQVKEQDSFAHITFNASNLGEPNLGHIVDNQLVRHALWQKVSQQDNVTVIAPARCLQLAINERDAYVSLDQGCTLSARLVVGADGANSWVRQALNVPLTSWDYGHHALVATVRCAEAHQQVARQIFRPEGPLAFLPLHDSHLCSIVWSLPPEEAQSAMAMPEVAFNQALAVAFDHQLGLCQLEGERQAIPLRMRYARDFVSARSVLLGDAAHTIHPLAGQGVNLGLMDAAALAQTLQQLIMQGEDIGSKRLLREFERWRKADAAQMIAAMEGFKQIYAGSHPLKKLLRGAGTVAVEQCAPLKDRLMRQAMGLTGDLPEMAQ
ncbi:FAD-dependent oxidoreductase [Thaumasiovibrio sp. DFM-14]|uniref:FAD-dependent oxidoreductase n=1 Tax=Thaumasiovibrio sp. DFM-14 TaxID=3384792 RepID=UPI00399FDA91